MKCDKYNNKGAIILPEVYWNALSYEEQIKRLYEYVCSLPKDNIYNNTFVINDCSNLADAVIPQKRIRSYSYDDMCKDIGILCDNYPKIRKKVLGTSVLGLELIALEYGTENATRHLFVFNGFHGNECSASIMLAELEVLAKNGVYGGVDMWEEILNNDTAIHVIPMANPDAWQLGLAGFSYFPDMSDETKELIKSLLEDYIRNYAKDEALGSNWDAESKENLENYIRSLGGNPDIDYSAYVFREEDLHCWESNANGIDLHYNWYTPEMKNTVNIALEGINHGHPNAYVYGAQGKTAYLDENLIYRNYIKSFERSDNNYYFNFLNYHQKGPTNIWNYRLKGLQNNRNFDCGNKLCELMQVPYSPRVGNQSTPIGFSAWGGIAYRGDYTLSFNMEIGWTYNKKRGDWWDDISSVAQRSPVPDEQWSDMYRSNKSVFIWFLRYYISFRDVWNRHMYLSEYNLKDYVTNERFAIPSMNLIGQIVNKVGQTYDSLSDMGLSSTSTMQDVIDKLDFTGSALFGITNALTISSDLPFWRYSTTGYLHFYPITTSGMVVDFYVKKTPYMYRKIYWSDGTTTDWINVTPISTDYESLGVTNGLPNATLEQLCSKVNIYQTLVIDLSKINNNIIGIPDEVGTNYRLKIIGHRPNNRVEINDINSGNTWINHYSRTNNALGVWYKVQATPL